MKKKIALFLSIVAFAAVALMGVNAYAYNFPSNAQNIVELDKSCEHSFVLTERTQAYCYQSGQEKYTCSKCNSYYYITITKNHSYVTKCMKKATATNSSKKGTYGYTVSKCKVCDYEKPGSYKEIANPEKCTLSKTSYTYDGKAKKPKVTVTDANGKTISSSNYTLTYSDNVKAGKAKVKVTFKNNYSGSISKYFMIKPSKVTLSSVSYKSTGKMTVKWSKNKSSSGYILQYSPSSKFAEEQTCTVIIPKNSTTSKTISALPAKKYYVRVAAYKSVSSSKYKGAWSAKKSVTIKKGASLKAMINYTKTDLTGRKAIKEITHGEVDIKKYDTTYDRIKAIYDWHSKNNTKYFADCMQCNMSFNDCIYCLYGESKQFDTFIWLAAGNFKNNDGSVVMHKWSVLYIQGVPYIFDPRLQGYTSDKTGTTYFGISKSDSLAKNNYLLDGYWFYWSSGIAETIV